MSRPPSETPGDERAHFALEMVSTSYIESPTVLNETVGTDYNATQSRENGAQRLSPSCCSKLVPGPPSVKNIVATKLFERCHNHSPRAPRNVMIRFACCPCT
jgi:hypothetical protein